MAEQLFAFSEDDQKILKEMVARERNNRINTPSRPYQGRSWEEGEDHQGPEVYIAKPKDVGTGTGTDGDVTPIGYSQYETFHLDRYLPLAHKVVQIPGMERRVHALPGGFELIVRTKQGVWLSIGGLALVGGCLDEDHPGRGVAFEIKLGEWQPSGDGWKYDQGIVTAIDWRYDVPYPQRGATGLFIARASDTYNTIYETVALDCSSPCEAATGSSSGGSCCPEGVGA